MLPLRHCLLLALHALRRNRLQTTLATIGMMVGVAALMTSVALGRGAQAAINEQLRAAGANVIVVTAGNYLKEGQGGNAGVPAHEDPLARAYEGPPPRAPDFRRASLRFANRDEARSTRMPAALASGRLVKTGGAVGAPRMMLAHYENDPLAVHDHPTAKERLGDAMAGLGSAATLTLGDAEAIRTQVPGVQYVASGVHEDARVRIEGSSQTWFTRMHGTEADLPQIRRGWTYPFGRFLTKKEVDDGAQVMVLGRVVADRLFGHDHDPVGRTVLLWNQPFRVVGVIGSRSWTAQPMPGDDQFDAFYVPVTTVQKLLNLSKLNTITITTESVGNTTLIARKIVDLLRKRHGISEDMPDDFTVRTQAQQAIGHGLAPSVARVVGGNMASVDSVTIEKLSSSLKRANYTMLGLLGGVATVSLLVGGIGIMNLLLLSVTERTREIGLRMALGARRGDVIAQFVSEAVLLSVVGGLLGALLGWLASGSVEQFFKWSTEISVDAAALAIAVAAVLGIVFGAYPAQRAARLDPIEALRHE